jgi:hypothetical protein
MSDSAFSKRLYEAGCRRLHLDDAIGVADKFLESTSIHLVNGGGMKLEQNSVVFHMLCSRHLILEKLRSELISRKLLPITMHSLCNVFATLSCNMVMSIPQ